jgi:hypothetical protein
MLNIQKAEYIDDYKIHLLFNNGRTGTANLEQTIFDDNRVIFQKLRNKQNFREFKLAHSTVVWLNELDLAPEYLFYLAFMKDNEFQEQFRQWGYIS